MLSQPSHSAADQRGIHPEHLAHAFRRNRLIDLIEMKQYVQHPWEPVVCSHATCVPESISRDNC